mmetsp:Transcript_17166/g.52150  ORF Transcript_17166/g.52150 Transcript_17166/m.52150 type:complete len:211 (+) Transcript_17166:1519-2151(+)
MCRGPEPTDSVSPGVAENRECRLLGRLGSCGSAEPTSRDPVSGLRRRRPVLRLAGVGGVRPVLSRRCRRSRRRHSGCRLSRRGRRCLPPRLRCPLRFLRFHPPRCLLRRCLPRPRRSGPAAALLRRRRGEAPTAAAAGVSSSSEGPPGSDQSWSDQSCSDQPDSHRAAAVSCEAPRRRGEKTTTKSPSGRPPVVDSSRRRGRCRAAWRRS